MSPRSILHIPEGNSFQIETKDEVDKVTFAPLNFPTPQTKKCSKMSSSSPKIYDSSLMYSVPGNHSQNLVKSYDDTKAYVMTTVLCKAIYGQVVLAEVLTSVIKDGEKAWALTNEKVAIKQLELNLIHSKHNVLHEDPMQEVAAMEYFAGFPGVGPQHTRHVLTPIETLYDDKFLYIVMPYCEKGELFDLLKKTELTSKSGAFTEEQARNYFRQVVAGVNELHKAGICHRDLSLENVLVDASGNCKIIDLGMCLRMPVNKDCKIESQGTCGKLFYMAPEVYNDHAFNGRAIDIWSIGSMLFMMLVGSPPFACPDYCDDCFKWIAMGRMRELLQSWGSTVSLEAIDLMEGMLSVDANRRIKMEDILLHPWIRNPTKTVRKSKLKRRMSAE